MTARHLRTLFLFVGLAVVADGLVVVHERLTPHYPLLVYLSGWILLGLCLYLTAFNARKKIPFLPFVAARHWLNVHIYGGLLAAVICLLHLRGHWPSGGLQLWLAVLFIAVTLSGIFGWWLSRTMPGRLSTLGGEIIYERVPLVLRRLRERAEEISVATVVPAGATTLAEFYTHELSRHFTVPSDFWAHVLASRRPLKVKLQRLADRRRYLTQVELKAADELAEILRQKDQLDAQRAGQLLLKAWLFVHIPLTYAMLIFTAVHVVVVYAFSGGAR
jgi:hypothetical protein